MWLALHEEVVVEFQGLATFIDWHEKHIVTHKPYRSCRWVPPRPRLCAATGRSGRPLTYKAWQAAYMKEYMQRPSAKALHREAQRRYMMKKRLDKTAQRVQTTSGART